MEFGDRKMWVQTRTLPPATLKGRAFCPLVHGRVESPVAGAGTLQGYTGFGLPLNFCPLP